MVVLHPQVSNWRKCPLQCCHLNLVTSDTNIFGIHVNSFFRLILCQKYSKLQVGRLVKLDPVPWSVGGEMHSWTVQTLQDLCRVANSWRTTMLWSIHSRGMVQRRLRLYPQYYQWRSRGTRYCSFPVSRLIYASNFLWTKKARKITVCVSKNTAMISDDEIRK